MRVHLLGLAGALVLAGCYRGSAHSVSPADVRDEAGWALVSGVHFIPQLREHDCGRAALAMVLDHWGLGTSAVDGPGIDAEAGTSGGIPAGVLRDRARQKGLAAFLIEGNEADLAREVSLNRPVLVGVVQRYTHRSYAHYEVITGFNARTRDVLMLDPGRGLRQDSWESFASEWGGSGHLALVVGQR